MSKTRKWYLSKEERYNKRQAAVKRKQLEEEEDVSTGEWEHEDLNSISTDETDDEVSILRDSARG